MQCMLIAQARGRIQQQKIIECARTAGAFFLGQELIVINVFYVHDFVNGLFQKLFQNCLNPISSLFMFRLI